MVNTMSKKTLKISKRSDACIKPKYRIMFRDMADDCFCNEEDYYPFEISIVVSPKSVGDLYKPVCRKATVSLISRMTRNSFRKMIKQEVFREAINNAKRIRKIMQSIEMPGKSTSAFDESTGVTFEIFVSAKQYLQDDAVATQIIRASYFTDVPEEETDAVFSRSKTCAVRDELKELIKRWIEDELELDDPA